ncbi:prepilin-type N-terminal cleavage/methylation domain-containing protein [Thiobacillus sp.]
MTVQRGFTLIEMAIVLVIITILIGGLAMPLSAQIQARRIGETRKSLEAIHDSLIGYAMSHTIVVAGVTRHYLPCPDTNNDGLEETRDVSGNCPSARGGLPWITLGVKGDDAWGNRYTYAADLGYTNNLTGFISTPMATPATLDIFSSAACAAPEVMPDVPAVVVSHGPQGRGALNMSGGTPLAPASVEPDERQNLNVAIGSLPCASLTKFVSHTPTDNFDDLVVWLSSSELFNRVCPSGGCL